MNPTKNLARAAGVLFITATAASFLRLPFAEPILGDANYLTKLSDSQARVVIGFFLELLTAVSIVGISLALFPVLKRHSEAWALGYIGFRVLEAAFIAIGAVGLLALLTLSQTYVGETSPDAGRFELAGTLLTGVRFWVDNFLVPISLSLGGLVLYTMLWRSEVVPTAIALWGLAGAALLLVSTVVYFFGAGAGSDVPVLASVLAIPLALNEIALAIWLIVKGFDPMAPALQETYPR